MPCPGTLPYADQFPANYMYSAHFVIVMHCLASHRTSVMACFTIQVSHVS